MARKGTKISQDEADARRMKCLELRTSGQVFGYNNWIEYCKKHYGDKSDSHFGSYWTETNKQYEEHWRGKLDAMLQPAMDELVNLLQSPNDQIRQKAIDQIIKYAGKEPSTKIEAKVEGDININLSWGTGE